MKNLLLNNAKQKSEFVILKNCQSNLFRISLILLLLLATTNNVFAQKEDYNWIFGANDDSRNLFHWDDDLNLNIDTASTDMTFSYTNSAISDTNGEMLFYTNGLRIYDASTHQLVENGDSLNYTDAYWNFANVNFGQYNIGQATIILPLNNEYSLFSLRVDTLISDSLSFFDKFASNLIHTKIVKQDNEFKVILKNKKILVDTLIPVNLTATRHANGRDWWLVCQEALSNCVEVILCQPDTIYLHHKECDGLKYKNYDGGYSTFSPDGSKLVVATAINGIKIFNFDRCSGELNLIEYIPRDVLMEASDPLIYFLGFNVISSNSRYLYTGAPDSLYQFDLSASNIVNSKELVAWIPEDSLSSYTIAFTALAPDGTMPQPNHLNYYAIIHNPDEPAQDIDLEMWIPLPKYPSSSMGNFPNYRLGRLIGSPCDTLYNSIEGTITKLKVLEAYPNPATNKIRIDYAGKFWEQVNNLHLKITDVLGQEFYNKKLPEYSARQTINLKNYPSGVYFVYLVDEGKVLGTIKFIRQ